MFLENITISETNFCNDYTSKNWIYVYQQYLQEKTKSHAGYPYNLNYDYSDLLNLFKFSINNLGDPFVESNYKIHSRFFEQEVIAFFAKLYQANNWWGYITNNGTEGNLYGLLLGRESYPDGILYASADSHYSVAKASRFFKIPHICVKSQSNGEMDYTDFQSKLEPNFPAIINLNVGTTLKGAVDNLDRILEVLEAKAIKKYYIHCDGALGGMLIPYLEPEWISFQRSIHSLAISGHKFIGCPFPCGIVLTHKALVEKLSSSIEYIGSNDTTIGGSRNGHAPLFLYHAIQQRQYLFKQEVWECVDKATYLYNQLKQAGLYCLLNPYSTTVVFPQPKAATTQKWQLATQGNLAHVVVMQNHSYELLDILCTDLLENQVQL
jgi:histidine decarboxylase